MSWVKPPHPDPSLDPFRNGVGVLSGESGVEGHVFTTVSWFWSPFSPLRQQWWVWLIVVWTDGTRERPVEDYPPWSYVAEMKQGQFVWAGPGPHEVKYAFDWLSDSDAADLRADLGVGPEDF